MAKLIRKYYETKQRSIRNIVDDIDKGVVSRELEIQRGFVWKDEQIELFIDSLCRGFASIHLVHIIINEQEYICDGMQRESSIINYILYGYKLKNDHIIEYSSGSSIKIINLKDKTFSELPVYVQNMIMNFEVNIDIYDGLSYHEICELFERLNGGTKLSRDWGYRTVLFAKDRSYIKIFDDLVKNHDYFFKNIMTKSNIKKGIALTNILKACMLIKNVDDSINLGSSNIERFIEEDITVIDFINIEKIIVKLEKDISRIKNVINDKNTFVPYIIYGAIFANNIKDYLNNINDLFSKKGTAEYNTLFEKYSNHITDHKVVYFRIRLMQCLAKKPYDNSNIIEYCNKNI